MTRLKIAGIVFLCLLTQRGVSQTVWESTYRFKAFEEQQVVVNEQQAHVLLVSPENTYLNQKGAPALPTIHSTIELPAQGKIEVRVVHVEYEEYFGVQYLPAKGVLKRNQDPAAVPYTFGDVYTKDEFYPKGLVHAGKPFVFRQTRGVSLEVCPVQYNPITQCLRVYSSIEVQVVKTEENGINELHQAGPDPAFEDIYGRLYANHETKRYQQIEEDGRMLVICHEEFMPEAQPLINWRKQTGMHVEVVEVPANETWEKSTVQEVIQAHYDTHADLKYVLLIGDHAFIPAGNTGVSDEGDSKWSDTEYAFIHGDDHYPEVLIGRLSAELFWQVDVMVDRILEYEKTPKAGDWFTNAIGIASNQGNGYGDEGEADWLHMRNIKQDLHNFGYTKVYELYDGNHGEEDQDGNPKPDSIQNAISSGASLFNYAGHGAENVCYTGNFGPDQINNATNNGMYPFVISVACSNGNFANTTCVAETWSRAKNEAGPLGAIAMTGSSILMAWAPPMATQDEIVDILTEQYEDNQKMTLGGLFYNGQLRMLEKYPNLGDYGPEVMETWVFFGDPAVTMRSKVPTELTVSHDDTFDRSEITVESTCEGAKVCISNDNEILGVAYVDGGGAVVEISGIIPEGDKVLVTVTCPNTIPYQGYMTASALVESIDELGSPLKLDLFPNPVQDELQIKLTGQATGEVELMCYDVAGRLVHQQKLPHAVGTQTIQVSTTQWAKGVYSIQLQGDFPTTVGRVSKQ